MASTIRSLTRQRDGKHITPNFLISRSFIRRFCRIAWLRNRDQQIDLDTSRFSLFSDALPNSFTYHAEKISAQASVQIFPSPYDGKT
jgi:hypothetical protein